MKYPKSGRLSHRVSRRRTYNQRVRKAQEWRQGRTRPRRRFPLGSPEAEKAAVVRETSQPLAIWPRIRVPRARDGLVAVTIPRIFSLIENPAESLEKLYELRSHLGDPTVSNVAFDHSKCQVLDLCASVVTDILVLRGRQERLFQRKQLGVGGAYSSVPEVNMLLKASGIIKHVGHPDSVLPKDVSDRLERSDLVRGRRSSPERTSESELAATQLTRFFDRCLRTAEHQF